MKWRNPLFSHSDMIIRLYEGLASYAGPILYVLLQWRRSVGKELGPRWRERTGEASHDAFASPTIWLHAASVGEFNAVLPLINALARLGLGLVVTTVTATSARLAAERLPPGVVHQFAPFDTPGYVRRFLDHWKPELAISIESEVWPATLAELERRQIPSILVNGRMSARSHRRWSRLGRNAEALFGKIRLCLAQSDADASRFRQLGAHHVVMAGNLKFDAPPPQAAPEASSALSAALGRRAMFLAASTHPGEEEALILPAAERLLMHNPGLLVTIAPRHPERGAEIAAAAKARGFRVAVRSRGELPSPAANLYVADTLGELGTLYGCASVAFIGGSFVNRGGHNPIEAVQMHTAILSGPHTANFEDIYRALKEARAVTFVNDVAELVEWTEQLMTAPVQRDGQVRAAIDVVTRLSGGLERTVTALRPYIRPLMLNQRLHMQSDNQTSPV